MIFDLINAALEVTESLTGIDLYESLDNVFSWARDSVGEGGDVNSFHDELGALEWRFAHR